MSVKETDLYFRFVISYPNAKINIGLNVTQKREDGFHVIESVFYPVPWRDILEIIPEKNGKGEVVFTSSGIEIPSNGKPNLCERVYDLLHEEFSLPSVKMHLHKIVPIGAGLGGGSADAAFTAKMLNDLFDLKMTDEKLEQVVGKVGSDCPFFIKNRPAFVTGIGNVLVPFNLNLSEYWIVLVNPNIHIGTIEAYAGIKPALSEFSLKRLFEREVSDWKDEVKNDFEKSVFGKYPALSNLKDQLYEMGAEYASMTGSGSTIYGLFDFEPKNFDFEPTFFVKVAPL